MRRKKTCTGYYAPEPVSNSYYFCLNLNSTTLMLYETSHPARSNDVETIYKIFSRHN